MANDNKEKETLLERLRHKYRLVVMHNDTFEEVGSYRFTMLNVYILGAVAVFLTGFLTLLLVSFIPPLRNLVPGYGDVVEKNKVIYALQQVIEEHEEKEKMYLNYFESYRKRMVGDVETVEDVETTAEEVPDSMLVVERIEEDEELRKEIELNELGQQDFLEAEQDGLTRNVTLDELSFYPPVNGSISEGFMPDKKHYGVDVMSPKNTPVKAVLDGVVITADWTVETGNTVAVQHSNNVISIYKHNSALLKKVGDLVKAGEALAIIGNTGTLSSGPHLHFELWHEGSPVDPSEYIEF